MATKSWNTFLAKMFKAPKNAQKLTLYVILNDLNIINPVSLFNNDKFMSKLVLANL